MKGDLLLLLLPPPSSHARQMLLKLAESLCSRYSHDAGVTRLVDTVMGVGGETQCVCVWEARQPVTLSSHLHHGSQSLFHHTSITVVS